MYLQKPHQRPSWLYVNGLLGEHGIPKDSAAGRRELERRVEAIRRSEVGQGFGAIRGEWCLGDDDFRQELLGRMSERMGAEHYGSERRESDEAKAERIIAEEFTKLGWKETDLHRTRKGDPAKLAIVLRLRAETVMSVGWIANRLKAGARSYLNHLLYKWRRSNPD